MGRAQKAVPPAPAGPGEIDAAARLARLEHAVGFLAYKQHAAASPASRPPAVAALIAQYEQAAGGAPIGMERR